MHYCRFDVAISVGGYCEGPALGPDSAVALPNVCLMHLKRDLQELLVIPEFLSLPALCKLLSLFETMTVNWNGNVKWGLYRFNRGVLVVHFQQQSRFIWSKKLLV